MTTQTAFSLEQFSFSGSSTLAQTADLTPQQIAAWRGLASVQPIGGQAALGVFAGPDDHFLIAHAHVRSSTTETLGVIVPRALLHERAGHLMPLMQLIDNFAHIAPDTDGTLSRLDVSAEVANAQRDDKTSLSDLVKALDGDFAHALQILNAALHDRGVLIYGFSGDTFARVHIIEGLMALLPTRLRPDFTFSTNRHEHMTTQARLVFAERHVTSGRAIVDWEANTFPSISDLDSLATAYVRQLEAAYAEAGSLDDVLRHVEKIDTISATLRPDKLAISLGVLAERFELDSLVDTAEELPVEAITSILRTAPPTGTMKFRYASRLLSHALETRDATASQTVTSLMDADPTLDAALTEMLDDALSTQPDAVYAFVRSRLAHGAQPKWLIRLKSAALASLKVALLDGDPETILNWLRLIAREPATYDLGDVLHQAILSAHKLARQAGDYPPELARGIILIAAKRDAAAAEILLSDPNLVDMLPDLLGPALRDHTGDPGALLQSYGLEVLLVALARAAERQLPDLFNSFAIEQIWTLYLNAQAAPNSPYSAEMIMKQWLEHGAGWLNAAALGTLLTVSLRERRDDIFHKIAHPLHERDDYVDLVAGALSRSGRGVNDSLALIAQMIAVGDLNQQSTLEMYVRLLDELEWHRAALPIMTQIARILQQAPTLAISQSALWQLLAAAAEAREDGLLRTVVRRMDAELNATADDAALVDSLAQLIALLGSSSARTEVMSWWRMFVRDQPTARLQKLEKLFDGRKLDDLRLIIQSAIAFRRMLGKRTLTEFAEDVNIAFGILKALTESYDPAPKRPTAFDPQTIRAEIDSRREELSSQQQQILANNLKALATMIADMGDVRTKANLIRRSDDLDRQLMVGEQQPHSAVDVLKWFSGYLSGAQEEKDGDSE